MFTISNFLVLGMVCRNMKGVSLRMYKYLQYMYYYHTCDNLFKCLWASVCRELWGTCRFVVNFEKKLLTLSSRFHCSSVFWLPTFLLPNSPLCVILSKQRPFPSTAQRSSFSQTNECFNHVIAYISHFICDEK